MSARDDYPRLAHKAANQHLWFSGRECQDALDRIDALEAQLVRTRSEYAAARSVSHDRHDHVPRAR